MIYSNSIPHICKSLIQVNRNLLLGFTKYLMAFMKVLYFNNNVLQRKIFKYYSNNVRPHMPYENNSNNIKRPQMPQNIGILGQSCHYK